MHVYFVRHGETELNRKKMHQSPNTPLSEKGLAQARSRAEELRSINPDLLITSSYTRAMETARVIGGRVGLSPVVHSSFHEVERPPSFYGTRHFSIETFLYVILTVLRSKHTDFRYKGAENIHDIASRAREGIKHLESLTDSHQSVIVVSHAVFINMLVSLMCEEKLFNFWEMFLIFIKIKKMKNTEIIHVEYTGEGGKKTCSWRKVTS